MLVRCVLLVQFQWPSSKISFSGRGWTGRDWISIPVQPLEAGQITRSKNGYRVDSVTSRYDPSMMSTCRLFFLRSFRETQTHMGKIKINSAQRESGVNNIRSWIEFYSIFFERLSIEAKNSGVCVLAVLALFTLPPRMLLYNYSTPLNLSDDVKFFLKSRCDLVITNQEFYIKASDEFHLLF